VVVEPAPTVTVVIVVVVVVTGSKVQLFGRTYSVEVWEPCVVVMISVMVTVATAVFIEVVDKVEGITSVALDVVLPALLLLADEIVVVEQQVLLDDGVVFEVNRKNPAPTTSTTTMTAASTATVPRMSLNLVRSLKRIHTWNACP